MSEALELFLLIEVVGLIAAPITSAIAPTLNVITTDVNERSADLIISSVIANSTVGGAGIGGWSNLANGGAALTKTDDTNVTLTLGGTPATALLKAASLTLGWTPLHWRC